MAKLYIVPTPIGNLDDITLRAVNVLRSVDFILAEDTRTTSFLLKHLGIEQKLRSHHKFNEHATVRLVAESIAAGRDAALVSDAGTPGISDPGFLLVRTCVEAGIEVETLPGATALIPALVQSGFPCDRFCFEGFLPQKKGRSKQLQTLADEDLTDNSIFALVAEHSGRAPLKSDPCTVEIALADAQTAPLLEVPVGEPLFYMEAYFTDAGGRPLLLGRQKIVGSRYVFDI